ncbi:MAG: T9SS type A sorting domain-containing protein [Flavobacteriales bacterium]|nr:T9SS type A sorting domain-containing protein [Flavobacteriales bacterium]
MKKIYLFALAIFGAFTTEAQLFFDDFEDNNLDGYTLYNLDELTPDDPDLITLADSAWAIRNITSQGWTTGNSAFSVSWYVGDAGPANDWLVTPAIQIGENAVLSWNAMAITSSGNFRDTYQVFISNSTDLNEIGLLAPEFFTGDTGEFDAPVTRTLDLGALGYANETIHVCFRNNTPGFNPDLPVGPGNGGNELAIDNITVTGDPLSTQGIDFIEEFKIQPNPVSSGDNIQLVLNSLRAENISVEVIDISGKVLKLITNQNLPSGTSRITIERDGMAPGLYLIRLRSGDQSSVLKTILN